MSFEISVEAFSTVDEVLATSVEAGARTSATDWDCGILTEVIVCKVFAISLRLLVSFLWRSSGLFETTRTFILYWRSGFTRWDSIHEHEHELHLNHHPSPAFRSLKAVLFLDLHLGWEHCRVSSNTLLCLKYLIWSRGFFDWIISRISFFSRNLFFLPPYFRRYCLTFLLLIQSMIFNMFYMCLIAVVLNSCWW